VAGSLATCRWRSLQLRLDRRIQEAGPDGCWPHRGQGQARRWPKRFERPAPTVVEAGIASIEGGPIITLGMVDQAAAGGGQGTPRCRAGRRRQNRRYWQPNPVGIQQQGGAGAHTGQGPQQAPPRSAACAKQASPSAAGSAAVDRPAASGPPFPPTLRAAGASKGTWSRLQPEIQPLQASSFPGANGLEPRGGPLHSLELPELQTHTQIFLGRASNLGAAGGRRRTGGRNPRPGSLGLYPHRFRSDSTAALAQLGGAGGADTRATGAGQGHPTGSSAAASNGLVGRGS